MMRLSIVLASLALAVPAAAQDAPAAAADPAVQDCSAYKFETFVERVVDGQPRKSRVRLCGKSGQSAAEWIATLEDAIAKLQGDAEMPADSRRQIITAITGEIARLRDPSPASATASAPPALTPRATPRERSIRDEYANIPAMPPPVAAKPAAPAPLSVTPSPGAPVRAQAMGIDSSLAAPSLAFDCYVAGDLAPAECIEFQRDTMITVRANSDVPAGTELRFERNGSERAKVAIGPLKSGRSKRVPLPAAVCQGFGDGRLDIGIWNGARTALTEGPFPLRCS